MFTKFQSILCHTFYCFENDEIIALKIDILHVMSGEVQSTYLLKNCMTEVEFTMECMCLMR